MPSMPTTELTRQRLLAIRAEFRRLLELPGGQPLRNKAVFYSGTRGSIDSFCAWLGRKNSAFLGATNLERLPAGLYLERMGPELIRLFGTADFDQVRTFVLPGGSFFSGSINGLWRELSARYAKACAGAVHVLVSHQRAQIHRESLAFWARSGRRAGLPKDLRVLGFVELPILLGQLSRNLGVTAVDIYIENHPGSYTPLTDGRYVISPGAGSA